MLYRGRRRYNAFLKAPEDIRTNTLAERLRRLESNGIILKKEYQDNPIRYEYYLTDKGKELQPIVDQIAEWGLKHFPGTTLNKKA